MCAAFPRAMGVSRRSPPSGCPIAVFARLEASARHSRRTYGPDAADAPRQIARPFNGRAEATQLWSMPCADDREPTHSTPSPCDHTHMTQVLSDAVTDRKLCLIKCHERTYMC